MLQRHSILALLYLPEKQVSSKKSIS